MQYIGNFKEWINPEWIDELLSSPGIGKPRDRISVDDPEYGDENTSKIYDLNSVHFWLYNKSNLSFNIDPPWIKNKDSYWWWITKMNPGQFIPYHVDPHTQRQSCRRYWVPLLDHKPGHLFIIDNKAIMEYRAGDQITEII